MIKVQNHIIKDRQVIVKFILYKQLQINKSYVKIKWP